MSCPICNEPQFLADPVRQRSGRRTLAGGDGDDAGYDWRLCRRCGNAYPSHQPDLAVLRRVWAEKRGDECLSPDAKDAIWSYRRAISRAGATRSFRLFAPLCANRPGRFLDVACGLGETVRIFADNGWDAEGIDADPSTARFHRDAGIRARIGQFEQIEAASGYDLIHIAHAIYFITDPMDFIRGVRARLAPGGLFCVVLADFMASADASLPSYTHTFFPTGASMRYALATRRLRGSPERAQCPAASSSPRAQLRLRGCQRSGPPASCCCIGPRRCAMLSSAGPISRCAGWRSACCNTRGIRPIIFESDSTFPVTLRCSAQ